MAPVIFKEYYAGITEGYEVGSDELAALNEFTPDIPYVAFYGIETEPIIWNTLVHLLPDHEPNNDIIYGAFGAGNDDDLAIWANATQIDYLIKYLSWQSMADDWEAILDGLIYPGLAAIFSTTLLPFSYSIYKKATTVSDAWQRGCNWFEDANPFWKCIIGAEEYIVGETWTCICINEDDFDLTAEYFDIEVGGDCSAFGGDCTTFIDYDMATKQSDGIVLVESASTVLGMTHSKEMEGSNHFSMRNDENTENRLSELFSGFYGDYFITLER